MSTRCVLNFHENENSEPEAKVYRHSDGYPEGVLPDLEKFFNDVIENCHGNTRFDDPSYLAAKFVVWQMDYALPSLGCGILMKDPGDIEWSYKIICSGREKPRVITNKV